MSMFTAVFTYKGKQSVRQVEAEDAAAASRSWGKGVQFPEGQMPVGLAEATEADNPLALKGMSGAFTQVLTFGDDGKDFGVLTLVKTQTGKPASEG